jgi:hypothetical protein
MFIPKWRSFHALCIYDGGHCDWFSICWKRSRLRGLTRHLVVIALCSSRDLLYRPNPEESEPWSAVSFPNMRHTMKSFANWCTRWAKLIVLPAIALAIGTAILCDVEEGRYANKYKFEVGLAIPYIAFLAYLWSALYDLWNYCYASGSDTSPTLNGQSSPPLELVRSIAAFCIGIFVTGPQPAPPTDLENGADMGASNMNTNTSNERHGPQVHSPTGQLPAAMPDTPQNEQNTYPRRARRSRGRAHPRRPEWLYDITKKTQEITIPTT